jgi:hypothetical protein
MKKENAFGGSILTGFKTESIRFIETLWYWHKNTQNAQ